MNITCPPVLRTSMDELSLLQGTLHQTCACQLLVWTQWCIQWRSNPNVMSDVVDLAGGGYVGIAAMLVLLEKEKSGNFDCTSPHPEVYEEVGYHTRTPHKVFAVYWCIATGAALLRPMGVQQLRNTLGTHQPLAA